jgi:hypothetical protein
MKHIKNWTVTSEAVKNKTSGLIKYMDYLNNPNHDHHQNTEILDFFNNPNKASNFIKKCTNEAISLDMANIEKKKGGRPVASYAVSFDFIMPPNTIRPTKEQWQAIGKDLYKVLQKGTENKLTSDHVYMNIHDQSNPHLNLVVSKIIDGNRERKIDQKAILNSLKTQFNKSILDHCDFDYRDYVPEQEKLGKRKQKWQFDLNEIKKAHKQFEALLMYSNENNAKRVKSTKNRIIKTLSKISENNQNEVLDQMSEIEDPAIKELVDGIRKEVDDYNPTIKKVGSKSSNKYN